MSYNQLTEHEPYQIYNDKRSGYTQVESVELLGRHSATISRELRRSSGLRGYRPCQAQKMSYARRHQS